MLVRVVLLSSMLGQTAMPVASGDAPSSPSSAGTIGTSSTSSQSNFVGFDADIADAESKFDKAVAALANQFSRLRTGRASPALVEHLQVEAYGSMKPLNQCAAITVPEPTLLAIKAWDKGLVRAIEKAISDSGLGLRPISDGQFVRVRLPPLSQERRKQLAGQAKAECEKAKVAMRNIRRDAIKQIENKGKELKASEDLIKKSREKIDALLKDHEQQAEKKLAEKSKDILEG